jgi:hypothetical protein
MKRIVVVFLFVASSVAQEKRSDIVLHKFATWESLRTPQEKLVYEQGFMNGYFAGPPGWKKKRRPVNCPH